MPGDIPGLRKTFLCRGTRAKTHDGILRWSSCRYAEGGKALRQAPRHTVGSTEPFKFKTTPARLDGEWYQSEVSNSQQGRGLSTSLATVAKKKKTKSAGAVLNGLQAQPPAGAPAVNP